MSNKNSYPICAIGQGILKGQYDVDIDGNTFLSFMGIPYAKPPIGELRFRAPQPPEKWTGIRDATKDGNPCFSLQFALTKIIPRFELQGSEDCLFLNVFTRQLLTSEEDVLKPVMVWIHGGAFFTGSSHRDNYGPEHLMTEDVVLVTLNYRLGALGFLVIDDKSLEITGNAGLKDQLQALKWVNQNIKYFGGDPCNVTVFGQSAGSASAHFLLLSPLSKDLIHKAILQSGSALCAFSRGINNAKQLAEKLGCMETSSKNILQFLQNVPVKKLVKAQNKIITLKITPGYKISYGPTVEKNCKCSLVTQEPLSVIKSGSYHHIPLMIGYTSREGIFDTFGGWCFLRKKVKSVFPFYYGLSPNTIEYDKTQKKLIQFYFGQNKIDYRKKDEINQLFTDATFLRAIYLTAKFHAATSDQPVYYYRISLETELNFFKKLLGAKKGVCHGDDCAYLFKFKNVKFKKDSIEHLSVRRFVRLWCNFARTGNPTPEKDALLGTQWKPVTRTEMNFLEINTSLVPAVDPDAERMKFWDKFTNGLKINYL